MTLSRGAVGQVLRTYQEEVRNLAASQLPLSIRACLHKVLPCQALHTPDQSDCNWWEQAKT